MRLVANDPFCKLVYAAGEGSAGSRLVERLPACRPGGRPDDREWAPATLLKIDVLFATLLTGVDRGASACPKDAKIVDIGGGHRYVGGWAVRPGRRLARSDRGSGRGANPGCLPAATLSALAPLLANRLIKPRNIVIDAKTGISGAGRGGGDSKFGYAERNENLVASGLLNHIHMP